MAAEDVVSRVWALAEPVAASLGMELVEVDFAAGGGRAVLRLFIDRPEGLSVEDCKRMSREVEARLDAEDFLGSPYRLEVSSPGLDRPLRKPGDFKRYAGRRVRLRLRNPQEGPRVLSGTLLGIEGDVIAVDAGGEAPQRIALGGIAKARLEVDWEAEFRRPGKPAAAGSGLIRKGGDGR
ncbi:MAG: ribosome maturation factor RimP [Candidatus Tectomicrobia bacterium]|uniref:Ribosome maturation factor RimP n=1 Tax=Tectimicrobiota bacterium TaxID=2528274 RepID=A0A933E8E5_UNCTE|nr:ribosome maturation factor RimP [Candidatus Tectomicrobia bacterium]